MLHFNKFDNLNRNVPCFMSDIYLIINNIRRVKLSFWLNVFSQFSCEWLVFLLRHYLPQKNRFSVNIAWRPVFIVLKNFSQNYCFQQSYRPNCHYQTNQIRDRRINYLLSPRNHQKTIDFLISGAIEVN